MGRRTLLLITSILIAAIGAGLIGLYVLGVNQKAQADVAGVTVLTVRKDIPAGTTLRGVFSCACVTTVTATKATAAGAIPEQPSDGQMGQASTGPIPAGTILRTALFSAPAGAGHANLAAGYGVVVKTDNPTIKAGDQVAVWLRPDPSSQAGQPGTPKAPDARIVASPVRVASVITGGGGSNGAVSLQLDASKDVAQKILTAQAEGDVIVLALGPAALATPSPA